MVDEYSGLWAEDDPKEKAKRKAAEKEFLNEIEEHRLPGYKEVKAKLESLSSKKTKIAYIEDVILRYQRYTYLIQHANTKYRAAWEQDNINTGMSFTEEHAESMVNAQLQDEVIDAEYQRLKLLFASSNMGLIPGKILWAGKKPDIQIAMLIEEWVTTGLSTIYLDHEVIQQFISKRFTLGKAQYADQGDYIIWNDTNEKLLWWITCLVEEKLLNIEVTTGRLLIDTDSTGNNIYEREDVPKIVAFVATHFMKYKEGGLEFFSPGSLDSIHYKVKGYLELSESKLRIEKPDLYSILSSVREIAAL